MKKDIYLHSISVPSRKYSSEKTHELFEKILKSGAILSPKLSGEPCRYNFSGEDYISLCDYEKKDSGKGFRRYYNGFYQYAVYNPSIMIPKSELEVIQPVLLQKMIICYSNYRAMMKELGLEEKRYSDLEDEVQVRDCISLDKMCGVTMPSTEFIKLFKSVEHDSNNLYREILKLKELLCKYGYDVPFYDINTEHLLENYDDVYETVYILKKKK